MNSCNCSNDNHRKENNELLKSTNLKTTKKRMSLINCLRHADRPLSAEEIYSIIKENININLSTVYRTLTALCESDIVIRHVNSDGSGIFQLNTGSHKHTIRCKVCGKTEYVEKCPLPDILDEVENDTGYQVTSHQLEFIGICPECSEKIENK